jgi:GcrA cell cycle regulator
VPGGPPSSPDAGDAPTTLALIPKRAIRSQISFLTRSIRQLDPIGLSTEFCLLESNQPLPPVLRTYTVSSRHPAKRNQHMVWDEETIRLLRDLWAQGHSTAEIGRRLGVSKNAIVGKAHRLELDARPSPIKRDVVKPASERPPCLRAGPTLPPLPSANVQAFSATPTPSNLRPLRAAPTLNPRPVSPAPAAPLVQRPAMPSAQIQSRRPAPSCCWPIGEPGTKSFRFCDDLSIPGKPYCDQHAKLAYVRVRDRKEDAA